MTYVQRYPQHRRLVKGQGAEPEPEPEPALHAAADSPALPVAPGMTAQEFTKAIARSPETPQEKVARVRKENEAWRRRNHVGSRKQRGLR